MSEIIKFRERKPKKMFFTGTPKIWRKLRKKHGRDSGKIIWRRRKQSEERPSEETAEETCKNLVSFLKRTSDCEGMNNVRKNG